MILAPLRDSTRCAVLGAGFALAFEYLRGFEAGTVTDGEHPIRSDEVFARVQTYETSPATGRRFEAHRRYADVQFVAAGSERILYAPTGALSLDVPYDAAPDVAFFADPSTSSSLLLRVGDFAIFFPEDAHKPGCMAGGRHAVRKVVVKVRIEG